MYLQAGEGHDLHLGQHGPGVRTLQRALRAAGAHVALTGKYKRQTRRAVRAYQRSQDVPVTGVVDENTRCFLSQGGVLHHQS